MPTHVDLSESRPVPTPAAIAAMFLLVVAGFILGSALGLLWAGL